MKKTEKKKVIINADEAYHHIYDIKWTKREEKLMRLGFAKSRIYLGRYLTEYWQTPQEELYAELLSNEFREKLKKKKAKAYTKGYSEGYLKKEQEIKQNPRLGMTATEIGMINKNHTKRILLRRMRSRRRITKRSSKKL
jgi:flagellar biosynthesis/type III secretory pathway protein FliH